MKYKTLALFGLLILLAAQSLPTFGAASGGAKIQDIELTTIDFAGGTGDGFAITADGLTLADGAQTAVYTSPVFDAPFDFNTAVPKWQADIPEFTSMELNIHTRTPGGEWSEWYDIHPNDDFKTEGSPFMVGDLLVVSEADLVHRQFQFSVSFGGYAGSDAPVLRQLVLTIMDTTDGPTTAEMLDQQAALDAARMDQLQSVNGYPRPTVISRQVWCIYADCNYTAGLEYSPATHVVVHHTVSANDRTDWAAVVRAIWNYHTYTNGWGDIGYNYLIDRTGVIYEGHMNQDYLNLDVVGTHASAANVGSMGVSLIGTFTTAEEYSVYDTPPPAMLNAAANLIAWKADQRDIDVYSASRLVNMSWGLPHLMGHRDVYGGLATLCPGGNAYALLPYLRDQVAQRINFVSDYIYYDELSSAFTKSNNTWHEGPRGCGNNGHSYYTMNVNSSSLIENWGEWRPNVPENGRYEIQVYAPYCDIGGPETNGAIYTITGANGTTTKTVSHQDNVGLWMSLGEFNLNAGTGNLIRLTDLTSGDPTNYDYAVWFDGIRLRPLAPLATNVTPAANAWVKQATVNFTWNVTNSSSVTGTTIQVATDSGFSSIIYTQSWNTAVTTASHTFSQNYANLYWRIRLDNTFGSPVYSTATHFGLDMTAPSSQVDSITYDIGSGNYELHWQGSDNLSGVAAYDVEVRAADSATWTPLITHTTAVTTTFIPPTPGQVYWFRSMATDAAGNKEAPPSGNGDISTDDAVNLFNPKVTNQAPANNGLIGDATVIFGWVLSEIDDPLTSTLHVATDAAMSNTILTKTVTGSAVSTSHTFGQDYANLYWQVTVEFTPPQPGLVDTATSAVTRFALDITPPSSYIDTIYKLATGDYFLHWQSSDAISGVASYTIEYRMVGDTVWTELVAGTTAVSTNFAPPNPAQSYEFRVQAFDNAGNVESPHTSPDISTTQAALLSYATMLPIIQR
ncbi:MAG: N-acetylmuramoyl-L-alanine amidase [Ardenticatenaceae bacterium]|nr:N-acetylmuramoyl-L-alanine amidase [Ardenticatenaceae bacterium]